MTSLPFAVQIKFRWAIPIEIHTPPMEGLIIRPSIGGVCISIGIAHYAILVLPLKPLTIRSVIEACDALGNEL